MLPLAVLSSTSIGEVEVILPSAKSVVAAFAIVLAFAISDLNAASFLTSPNLGIAIAAIIAIIAITIISSISVKPFFFFLFFKLLTI